MDDRRLSSIVKPAHAGLAIGARGGWPSVADTLRARLAVAGRALVARLRVAVALLLLWIPAAAHGDSPSVAVLYPEMDAPYDMVFRNIIDGIESASQMPVERYALPASGSTAPFAHRIDAARTAGVIALGRRGIEAAQNLRWGGPQVMGAIIWDRSITLGELTGISLDPSPRLLFSHLRRINPRIRRIYAVSNPDRSAWVVALARRAAADLGFALDIRDAASRTEALQQYHGILDQANPTTDAIWLPLDATTVDDQTILAVLLKEAWERHITTFSSTPGHAQRGVLFSVQPDHRAMGQDLAKRLMMKMREPADLQTGVEPLMSLKLAVNLRTAQHLGINVRPSDYDIGFR